MSKLKDTMKPERWVLIKTNDINGENYNRVLAYFESNHTGRPSWRLSEPTKKEKQGAFGVEYTDTQGFVYDCNYKREGFNDFLADKYDRLEHEQRKLFSRQIKVITAGDTA